jgi:GxxExxY protein
MMEHSEVTQKIIGCAMTVHSALGPGFLESVYQNALAHEMRKAGLDVECEKRLQVTYDDIVVGDFSADMVINGCILIENKAVQTFAPAHEVQLVNYLTATGIEIGLLLNFGAARLEFKRKTRTYQARKSRQDEQDGQDENPASALALHPVNPVHPVEKNHG